MASRRHFLKSTLLGASALSLNYVPASTLGANERIRVGVLGVGGRGNDHCKEFSSMANVQLAAVADPDDLCAQGTKKRWEESVGAEIQAFQDPRRIIEDQSIDVVSVASVNHWHALLTLWAAEAGKHVYVEKPCCHTIFEGRQLVNATKKYGVLIQHGTQNRSVDSWRLTAAAFQSGKYGKPKAVFAHANRPRNGIGFKPEIDPPQTLNWDLWLGPVNYVRYRQNIVPYLWHWYWNTGDGEIGNNGVHFFDLCRLALGNPYAHPKKTLCFGSRIVNAPKDDYRDQGETPTIQAVLYEMDGIPCYFSSCNLRDKESDWKPIETAQFITEDGVLSRGAFVTNSGESVPIDGSIEFAKAQPGTHFENFINCVRENAPEKLNAPIREGLYSTAFCHLGNISYRVGRPAPLSECLDSISEHPLLRSCVEGALANAQSLLKDGVDLTKIPFTLGQKIEMDSSTEKFTNSPEANALLRAPGRGEYVVRDYGV